MQETSQFQTHKDKQDYVIKQSTIVYPSKQVLDARNDTKGSEVHTLCKGFVPKQLQHGSEKDGCDPGSSVGTATNHTNRAKKRCWNNLDHQYK